MAKTDHFDTRLESNVMLLSSRLVGMIEEHSSKLTPAAVEDLWTNPKTPSYHSLSKETLNDRVFDAYRNLGQWLTVFSDDRIESAYLLLAMKRREEGVPLSEMVYASILIKYHLRKYINASGLTNSAEDLYQEQELQHLLGRFFDQCIYYAVKGYEEAVRREAPEETRVARI